VSEHAEAAVERAVALLDLKRPDEALEHLRAAAVAAPEVAEVHCLIALARLQLGDSRAALEAAETAVACGPEHEWGHRLRSIALLQLGRKGEARDAALVSAGLAPTEATTHIVLASALQAVGDEAGAEAAARHAVTLDPDDADTHSTLGEVLFEQDRHWEAIQAYEDALRINPEDPDTLNNLAVARLRNHDRDGVGDQFESAAMLDPRHEIARHNILHTGRAGRSYVYRRFTVTLVACALLLAFSSPGGALFVLVIAGALEAMRAADVRGLSDPTRHLLADDRRARRWKPARWDWSWPGRLRPWWWILLTQLPAPLLLALNVVFLALAITAGLAVWSVALAIAVPFSVMRCWRWYRRRHPGASSWRPPA